MRARPEGGRGFWGRLRRDRRAMAGLCFLAAEVLLVLLLPPLLGLEPNVTDRAASGRLPPGPTGWAPTTWAGTCSPG